MKKVYPRARISRHPNLDGWVIELIQREGVKPKRIAATYATIVWADRAARLKLGVKGQATPAARAPRPKPPAAPGKHVGAGICGACDRPMRKTGTSAADHPGTVLRQRDGICQSCNRKTA